MLSNQVPVYAQEVDDTFKYRASYRLTYQPNATDTASISSETMHLSLPGRSGVSKTDLRMSPIYHRLEKRIEAHICISFVSYKIYKEQERELKIKEAPFSAERAIEIIKSIYGLTLEHPHSKKTKNMIFAQKEN